MTAGAPVDRKARGMEGEAPVECFCKHAKSAHGLKSCSEGTMHLPAVPDAAVRLRPSV